MGKTEILQLLQSTSCRGAAIGALLLLFALVLAGVVVGGDPSNRLDRKGLRNPELVILLVRSGYVITVTGCLVIVISVAVALAGTLIVVANPKVWFAP